MATSSWARDVHQICRHDYERARHHRHGMAKIGHGFRIALPSVLSRSSLLLLFYSNQHEGGGPSFTARTISPRAGPRASRRGHFPSKHILIVQTPSAPRLHFQFQISGRMVHPASIARIHRAPSIHPYRPSPHHRRPVMVDKVPSTLYPLIKIGRKNLALLSRLSLVTADVLQADDPGKIARHLDQDIRQLKLH